VSVALLAGVIGLLAADWKLPDRFYEPALSVPAVAGLALLAWRRADAARQHRFGSLAVSTACVAAVVLAVFHVQTLSAGGREAQGDLRNMTSAVEQLNPRPGDLYVAWGGDFPYNHLVTPLGGFSAAGNLQMFPLGWANHAPFLTRRLVQFGVGDLYTAFWQRQNVLLISSPDRCERLTGFLALHYGQIVACVRADGPLPIHRVIPVTVRGPSINVRWAQSVTSNERLMLEQRYGLERPRALEDRTWRYELADGTQANLSALIRDPRVSDTAGLDRQTGALIQRQPDW
jgi:hypothetical protein